MPVQTTYPGVYIEELPSGVRTITGVSTSVTAFVGYTPQGPFNEATRILSPGDYERIFGPLHRDSRVSYAIRQFFDNGGSDAYVVRVAQNVASARVTLLGGDVSAPSDILTLTAANPGTWANQMRVDVDYNTTNPDSTFNLTLSQLDQGAVVATETHRNLSVDSTSGQYVVDVINSGSSLVTATRAALTFTEPGRSLSGDLSAGFTVTETTITGTLDGAPFSLLLTGTLPTTAATLESSLTTAITAAGLGLTAVRADANGTASATGDHVQLTSVSTGENASVVVTSGDPGLRLGLLNGGREFAGAAGRRPFETGTTSGDLTDRIGVSLGLGNLTIEVTDNSPGGATLVGSTSLLPLADDVVGTGLRDSLQAAIRAIANPATQNATVDFVGGRLRLLTSSDSPNTSINVLTGGGTNGLRTTTAQGGFENVQSYSLGSGATFGAQSGASLGDDGTPPTANEIIGSEAAKTGIHALLDVDIFNILVIPETSSLSDTEAASVIDAAINLCENERAFFIVDPRSNRTYDDIADWVDGLPKAKNAAVYFPRIVAADPLNGFRLTDMPASGAMAGIYARTDTERGVWKSPAGTEAGIRGTQALAASLTDPENGTLNPLGVNTLRNFPVYGRVSWGARTLDGADARASEWKYLAVRRTALFIEESLFRGVKWVVFEPNDEPLWAQIRLNVGAFMHDLFRKGAFQGATPREAYLVKCDSETTTQNDINLGVVNILVGFAPLKPAEFVILKIQQLAGQQA